MNNFKRVKLSEKFSSDALERLISSVDLETSIDRAVRFDDKNTSGENTKGAFEEPENYLSWVLSTPLDDVIFFAEIFKSNLTWVEGILTKVTKGDYLFDKLSKTL